MLSTDLAELYGVEPRALVQSVKRNLDRFPADFMFQLSREETSALKSQSVILDGAASSSRSQFVILKRGQNIKYAPYAFTEQGVAMLSFPLTARGQGSALIRQRLEEANVSFSTQGFIEQVRRGHAETVNLFLEAGMSPNVQDKAVISG